MNGILYDLLLSASERKILHPLRERLLRPIRGAVVEIGAGTGATFSYYGSEAQVIAVEPDPSMLERAENRAKGAAARIDVRRGDDRFLDEVASDSLDAVVFSLLLCSVEDPLRVLSSARRVLNADGKLILIEHVRSPGCLGSMQDALTPLWGFLMGGCHLNCQSARLIQGAGFEIGGLECERVAKYFIIQELIHGSLALHGVLGPNESPCGAR